MNTMSYKGYVGSIEVSEEDNCLYGKVLDLPAGTVISYEGVTVAELRADFEGAVNDYLAYCEENGIQPKRSYTGTLSIRISPETHSRIAYNHITLPLTAIDDFEELGKTDPRFQVLAQLVAENNGLWSAAAEKYLLANF